MKITVENLYGKTTTQLASCSAEKKRLQMITILGANHSPRVEFIVFKGSETYNYNFLHQAVDKYNE